MRVRTLSVPVVAVAAVAFGQQIADVSQLVGKKVVAQRMPLCEPGTYNTVLAYAGKAATILSAKPSHLIPGSLQVGLTGWPFFQVGNCKGGPMPSGWR